MVFLLNKYFFIFSIFVLMGIVDCVVVVLLGIVNR